VTATDDRSPGASVSGTAAQRRRAAQLREEAALRAILAGDNAHGSEPAGPAHTTETDARLRAAYAESADRRARPNRPPSAPEPSR
jgi:hypothetical protein